MSSEGIFVVDNRIPSHFESNSWLSSFRRTTVNRSAYFSTESLAPMTQNVLVDQVSDLSSTRETVLFLGLLFLQTDSSFEVKIMDNFFSAEAILASSTSKFGIEIPLIDPLNQPISTSSIHNISFRKKLWTSTYLGLESHLPTSERGWCWEFVKMRIWNLQSLLVGLKILWKSSLTGNEKISGWRSQTGISDPELVFGFHSSHVVMCVLIH